MLATSKQPKTPNVEFTIKRMKDTKAPFPFPCSTLFTAFRGSVRLSIMLLTQVRTGFGVTAL
jgi:hypothetical protein